jgi:hypothetical protein
VTSEFANIFVVGFSVAIATYKRVLRYDLRLRTGAELFTQPAKTAFVNQVVKRHFPRKKSHSLDSQVEAFNINLAFRAIASNNKRAEAIDMTLEISINLLVGLHGSI